jgi:hypothetical protein
VLGGQQTQARRDGGLDRLHPVLRPVHVERGRAAPLQPEQQPLRGALGAEAVPDVPDERPVDHPEQHRPAARHHQQPAGQRLRHDSVHVVREQRVRLGVRHRRHVHRVAVRREVAPAGGDEADAARPALQKRTQLVTSPDVVDDQQPRRVAEQLAEPEPGLLGVGQGGAHAGQGLAQVVDLLGETGPRNRLAERHPQQPAGEPLGDLRTPAHLGGDRGLPEAARAGYHDRAHLAPRFAPTATPDGEPANAAGRRPPRLEQQVQDPAGQRGSGHHAGAARPRHPRPARSAAGRRRHGRPARVAQLHQRFEHRAFELGGVAERLRDQAGFAQPSPERELAGAVHRVGERGDRDLGVVGEQEHQPRDARLRRGVELELGVGLPGPAGRRLAVAEPDDPDVGVAGPDLGGAELRRIVVAGAEILHVDDAVAGPRHRPLGRGDERHLPRERTQLPGVAKENPPLRWHTAEATRVPPPRRFRTNHRLPRLTASGVRPVRPAQVRVGRPHSHVIR